VGEHVGQSVEDDGGRGLQAVEHHPDRRADRRGRWLDDQAGDAVLRLGDPPEVEAVVGAEPQRVGESRDDLRGRVPVAALLQPGQVLDADPGQRGQLTAPQPGRTPPATDGQADRGRGQGLPAGAQERTEFAHGFSQ